MIMFIGLLLASLLGGSHVQAGTHVITFPNTLIPGLGLDIRVTVVWANGPVTVETLLKRVSDNSTVSRASETATAGIPKIIRLPVSDNVVKSQYKVVVSGSNGLNFRNESTIYFDENSLLTFIQTDKSRYSGGQEVKYRAIFMRPNLLPYEGPVKLTIHDGQDNMIETVEFTSTRKGVVNGSLLLGQEPVFGTWSITAEARILNKSYLKKFEVKDYILPKFEVKITVPVEVKDTTTSFVISVEARFTFETNVFGNCTIQIYNSDITTRYVEYSKQIFGVANFTVPMSDIKSKLLITETIKVRALVSDNATFLTMVNEKDLVITIDSSGISVTQLDQRDYYLPGMTYQTTIILKRQGKPVRSTGSVKVVPTVYVAQISTCPSYPYRSWLNVQRIIKPEFTVNYNENGYGFLQFHTEHRYDKITFEFSLGSAKDEFTIYAFSKNLPKLFGLSTDKGYAKVGDSVRVKADSSENLEGYVQFEVFARGLLLQDKRIYVYQTKTTSFDLTLSSDMVPLTYVVATHVKAGVLLQDRVVLLVDGPPFKNKVSVEINGTTFKPRDGIQFALKASPGSTVHILVEDERNRLLGVENDIFAYEITNNLLPVGKGTNRRKRSTSTYQAKHNGLIVLTDFNVPTRTPMSSLAVSNPNNLSLSCTQEYQVQIPNTPIFNPLFSTGVHYPVKPLFSTGVNYQVKPLFSIGVNYQVKPLFSIGVHYPVATDNDQLQALNVPELIRSRFPETWLWEDYDTGVNGRVNVVKTLPDSVTTWVTSVFATDKSTGFGVPEEKYKIKVKQNFFLTLSTPPSLIINEEFLLQITVFNNLERRMQVQIQIDRSDDPSRPIPASTIVEPDQGHSTFVKISSNKPGVLKITARARAGDWFTTYATDIVEKEIIIRPQGIRKTVNRPKVVTFYGDGTVYRETIPFGYYLNMIPGSRHVYMTITGDLMTPTITGLQSLILAPCGCGEQNMVRFAPDVFITNYLKLTGQLTKAQEKDALSHIRTGYQNELSFKRTDGSYSAFVSDPYGGTWLTAYVLKCFQQTQDLITIDPAVLDQATSWLLSRQNVDGSFREQSPVRYIDHVFSQLRMSAFVVISLLEVRKSSRASRFLTLNNVLSKGIRYMEDQLPKINDAYTLSITCYALTKYGSQNRDSCFGKLQTWMISQEGMKYWTENNRRGSTSAERAPAKDIEATAYVLLTYIAIGRHSDALPIVKWLASQRNAQGGFKTTQDTVMSVQALTEYSLQLSKTNPNPIRAVRMEAAGVGLSHTYAISNTNYNVTHRFTIPESVPSINISISGNGLAVFDVVETFYVSKSQDHPDISVSVTLLRESINSLTIRPVLSWKGVSTSNLLMMEIEMPTGFGADLEFVKRQSAIRRYESNGQMFVLYFNSLAPRQSVQVDVKMDRVDPVVGNQACHVTVYDYYEPEKQSTTTYESGILKRANICNVCPLCSWCRESIMPTFGGK